MKSERTFRSPSLETPVDAIERLEGFGERPAILGQTEDGTATWSYRRLTDDVGRLSAGLAADGFDRGDVAAILAGNRPEWVVAALAVIGAGGVVSPFDAQMEDETLAHVLDDSNARLVFTDRQNAERVGQAGAKRLYRLDAEETDQESWRSLLSDGADRSVSVEPGDVATLFYTSGTTGPPKGVPLSHGNIAFQINALIEAKLVRADDRVLLPLPLHHVYPFVIAMLGPVAMGIPIVMPQSLTGPSIVAAVRDSRATLMIGVPRLYDALNSGMKARLEGGGGLVAASVEHAIGGTTWLRRKADLDLGRIVWRPLRNRIGPSLRVMVSGGAALDPELARRLEGMGWTVATGYGLTETSPMLTWNLPDKGRLESAGRPVPGVEIRIDPAANPGEQPEGRPETGEILARGPNVFAGYRNLPDKSKESLTDDGWFRTGDLGYLDADGFLHIAGRVSTMIVTEGGENVAPDELEAAYGKHPAIAEIGVLQKGGRLVAVIVPALEAIEGTGREVVEEAIRDAVQERSRRLPSFMRLGGFRITREPIPRTRLGKPRRHLLGEVYERAGEEAPEARGAPVSPEDMAPEDRDLLADEPVRVTWERLAERYPDRKLSPDSDLTLDLGIDSMDWVNLTLEIGQRTGIELGDEAIARVESVRDLLVEVAQAAQKGGAIETASPFEEPDKVLSDRQKRWLKPLGPAAAAGAWVLYWIDAALMRTAFRLRVAGMENLPPDAPFILAPNHGSYLDPFAVAAALDYARLRKTYWGGWTGAVFVNPVTRLVARLAQAVPIDAKRAVISSLAFAAAALKSDRNLVWFPEGRRSQTGELQRFRTGLGMVLEHYPVPVVPVVIAGAHDALPPGRLWPRLRRVRVTFGEPLDAAQLKSEGEGERDADRIVHALRQRILKMQETVSSQN